MQEKQGGQNAQQSTASSEGQTRNVAGSQLDAGSFGGGNEGSASARHEAEDDRAGDTGGDGSSDVLGEEGSTGRAAGGL